jgi:hypothetical protein
MQTVVIIGRVHVPIEDIALVEPFDRASSPSITSKKEFNARVVRRNGRGILTEMTPQEFAEAHGFRMLSADNIAVSPDPAIDFRVETFERSENVNPDKPFLTRLRWRAANCEDRQRLLLTEPNIVLAVVLRGEPESGPDRKEVPRPARPRRPRRPGCGSAKLDSVTT